MSKKKKSKKEERKYFYALGRRKTCVATLRLFEGKGENIINGKKIDEIYKSPEYLKQLNLPFSTLDLADQYYFEVRTKGGGKAGMVDAIKLALSRALVEANEEYRGDLKKAGLLRVDDRVKERKKPGRKKARKKEQFSKR